MLVYLLLTERNSFAERKKRVHTLYFYAKEIKMHIVLMHKIFCALKLCALKILFWNFFLTVNGLASNQLAATFITWRFASAGRLRFTAKNVHLVHFFNAVHEASSWIHFRYTFHNLPTEIESPFFLFAHHKCVSTPCSKRWFENSFWTPSSEGL